MRRRLGIILTVLVSGFFTLTVNAAAQPAIRLRSRTFVPPERTLSSDDSVRGARSGVSDTAAVARRHLLVQFAAPISAATLADLRRSGATPLRYVPDDAMAIAAPAGFSAAAVPGVRWIGELQPVDRVSSETARDLAAAFPSHPLTIVEFHPDVARAEIDLALDDVAATTVHVRGLSPWSAAIATDARAIQRLAALDHVAWIYPGAAALEWAPTAECAGLVRPEGIVANYAAAGDGWDGPGRGAARLRFSVERPSSDVAVHRQLIELARAMAEWSRHAAVTWSPGAPVAADASVNFVWAPIEHGDGFPFDFGVLAHAFYPAPPAAEPLAGDVHFNDSVTWGIDDLEHWDIFSVALHELGHSLGLVHSDDPDSVMYPMYRGIVSSLSPADIAAVRSIYASSGTDDLISGWTPSAIGADANARAFAEDGRFTIASSGHDIWDRADEFSFVSRRLEGDGDIVARIDALDGSDRWSKAGVMIRAGLQPEAAHGFALVSRDKGLAFQRRPEASAESRHTGGGAGEAPRWLWLSRRGQRVEAYAARDGGAWVSLGTDTVRLPREAHVGLAVTSHGRAGVATAVFSNVTVTRVAGSPWQSADVGAVGRKGSWTETAGRIYVRGAGADIWDREDAFRFVWRPVEGDVDVVAHLIDLQGTRRWSKAGVMIRSSVQAGAAHAFLLGSAGKGFAFQRRTVQGGWSVHTGAGAGAPPSWLKLSRRGTRITASRSVDGLRWTRVGEEEIEMGATVLVGLAVSSHTTQATAEAVFDAVTVSAVLK